MARMMVAAAAIALGASGALGAGVLYQLEKDSYYQRDHCVGPCDCAPWSEEGPLSGTFVLSLVEHGPLYDLYAVSEVAWHVEGDHGPIDLSGGGDYRLGGEFALTEQMVLVLSDGALEDHLDSGVVVAAEPFPEIRITLRSDEQQCDQATIDVHAIPAEPGCYADCDADGTLDLFDFLCFQNAFAGGEVYADCDGSGSLDLFDFLCFQNEFAGGC